MGAAPYSAIDATGSYLYTYGSANQVKFLSEYAINSVSGALSLVASYTLGTFNPNFMTIDPGNKFLYVSGTSGTTTTNGYIYGYSITPSTGALTQIGTPLTGSVYYGYNPLVFNPTGNFAYAATASGTAPLTFNASTGALTPLSAPAVPGVFFFSLTIDPTGTLAWGISQINSYPDNLGPQFASYTINQTTGVFTQTGSYGPQPSPDTGFSAVNLVSH